MRLSKLCNRCSVHPPPFPPLSVDTATLQGHLDTVKAHTRAMVGEMEEISAVRERVCLIKKVHTAMVC